MPKKQAVSAGTKIEMLNAEIAKLKAELGERQAFKAKTEQAGFALTACGLHEIKTLELAIAEKEYARNKLA